MAAGFEEWLKLWPYALLMIAFASWTLYHFLAPASWREWAGAGVVQSFIIALYAEMYGFPLTIYMLTAALGLDIPLVHSSGHLWATLLRYGREGALIEMTIGYLFVLAGLLLVVKGWVRIYSADGRLQTDGVYGLVRHPQYAGLFLVVFGQLVHWPTIPTLLLAPMILILYVRLAHREEVHLIERFGSAYRRYQQRGRCSCPGGATSFTPWAVDEARRPGKSWGRSPPRIASVRVGSDVGDWPRPAGIRGTRMEGAIRP